MLPRGLSLADIREHSAQSLMRLGVMRVGFQGGLVMHARLLVPVGAKQEIAEIDARHRILRMMQDRLRVNAAGGVDRAHLGEQGAEFVQGAKMSGPPLQDGDEGEFCFVAPVERRKQDGALNTPLDRRVGGRAPRCHRRYKYCSNVRPTACRLSTEHLSIVSWVVLKYGSYSKSITRKLGMPAPASAVWSSLIG